MSTPITDPFTDPRPWEGPLSDPRNQIKKGDLVRVKWDDSSSTEAIAFSQDEDGDWETEDGSLITDGPGFPTWRIPAPAPEFPTHDGAVLIPNDGHELITTGDNINGGYARLTYSKNMDVWYGVYKTHDNSLLLMINSKFITPGTWKELQ